ncbi:hypothetical protein DOM21_08485 [Bacteriovorax stolpii]|nr:hypothetical protein DOM21_08485 [Bacteriovorax stolpii]
MRKPLLLCSIFLLSSCAYISKKFESMAENKNTSALPVQNAKINYCAPLGRVQYISEDEHTLKFYRTLNTPIFENKSLSFIERSIMLSLIEMSKRPDEASPFSRLQIYLKVNGKSYYYDFRPKRLEDDTKMPYLRGLDFLAQKFLPKQNLLSVATKLDALAPTALGVSVGLENFLLENQKDLIKNDELNERFLKGDDVLTRYETFERKSFRAVVEQYMSPTNSKLSDYEYEKNGLDANKSPKGNFEANCNYDLSKEPTLRDEMFGREPKRTHSIGMSDGQDYFLAVSSMTLFKPYTTQPKLSYFMKARPSALPMPICEFKGKNQEIVLFSSDGRNPVQHLQHLVAYEIDQIDSSYTLNELLNFSRHLFLSSPDRILYESTRGRKAQLDFFLAMNFPIYHVENLGNIFGHANFKGEKKQESSLHIDDRSIARLWCGQ